jgi:hypothetical protein
LTLGMRHMKSFCCFHFHLMTSENNPKRKRSDDFRSPHKSVAQQILSVPTGACALQASPMSLYHSVSPFHVEFCLCKKKQFLEDYLN